MSKSQNNSKLILGVLLVLVVVIIGGNILYSNNQKNEPLNAIQVQSTQRGSQTKVLDAQALLLDMMPKEEYVIEYDPNAPGGVTYDLQRGDLTYGVDINRVNMGGKEQNINNNTVLATIIVTEPTEKK